MPTKYFARFSRIIALVALENADKVDFKDLSSNYSENKIISIHTFLLSIPDLLERYMLILACLYKIMQTLSNTNMNNISSKIYVSCGRSKAIWIIYLRENS